MQQDELFAQLDSLTKKIREKDEYISKLEDRLHKLQEYQDAMNGREKPIEVTGHWVFELR